ncbi:hypothetical protein [Calidifontibacillus erzurumensis]|uniref:hypothetical protein n=1 Tax=Calidifontibacillus erzurumensis TaxID=2741433 RepID=UPI0035B555BE
MDMNQFMKRKDNLEEIEIFTHFTLYYDRKDKSLWVWNDNEFYGIDVEDLYEQLVE